MPSASRELRTRYPGSNVLDRWSSPDWDDQTRRIVRRRLEEVPPIRFFTEHEADTLAAVAERIVPQPDRGEAEKIPIVPWIDEKLYEDRCDGYRYEELPPQREAWRRGTCRMGSYPSTSVVNRDCRAHDVPNLFVCDGSAFPTSTAVNPSLTIEAVAARTADRIAGLARRGG